MAVECQHRRCQPTVFPDEPLVRHRQQLLIGKVVANLREDAASPHRYLFVLGEESRFDYLQVEDAHVVVLYDLLDDLIVVFVELLHDFLHLRERAFDALDHHVGKVLVVLGD